MRKVEDISIGLIGMGDMGKMYARNLSAAGKNLNVCDKVENYEKLCSEWKDVPGVTVFKDGHAVSRISDFIIYSVEAEFIGKVVAEYGPSTKVGAIVAGQTSVKAPEKEAFETYLPNDVHIISIHSLHGPSVATKGQPLVLIQHRASDEELHIVEELLKPFGSRYVYLSYEDHDLVTANTQAVTHAAFLSMGTAWQCASAYPWEHGVYVGGIETVKVNITLRIFSNQWHVYAGLAILNPSARVQIDQYAKSATEIFKLMLAGDQEGLRERMYSARDKILNKDSQDRPPILLSERLLDQFSLHKPDASPTSKKPLANSHLAILAMVDCWAALDIQPFTHLDLAATPIFRMWIGVAEYLFRSTDLLDGAINAAVSDVTFRSDDTEFVIAARGWSQCVSFGSFSLYKERFTRTSKFFESRFSEANKIGSKMIKALSEVPLRS